MIWFEMTVIVYKFAWTQVAVCVILGFAAGNKKNEGIAKNKQQNFLSQYFGTKRLYFCIIICCHKLVVQQICNILPNKWITVFYL